MTFFPKITGALMPSWCRVLNYLDHFLVFVCVIMSYVSTSVFASLVGVPVDIATFAAGLKICPLTAGIKKYKSIIKKKALSYSAISKN